MVNRAAHAAGRRRVLAAGVLAAALASSGAAAQQGEGCELALAFALDVSASVDSREYALQLGGLASALEHPEVAAAILAQPGGVALSAYEWSGRYQQETIAEWTVVSDLPTLTAFASHLAATERSYSEFPTAIGYALGFGAVLMGRSPPCRRKVIDISGDGVGNEGFAPAAAYREFAFDDVTVNGLAIAGTDPGVVAYYRSQVPHGPGSFVMVADNFADYAEAIRRKLIREIYGAQYVSAE